MGNYLRIERTGWCGRFRRATRACDTGSDRESHCRAGAPRRAFSRRKRQDDFPTQEPKVQRRFDSTQVSIRLGSLRFGQKDYSPLEMSESFYIFPVAYSTMESYCTILLEIGAVPCPTQDQVRGECTRYKFRSVLGRSSWRRFVTRSALG